MSTIPSEDAILALIDKYFPASANGVYLGRGDDCAILKSATPVCASTDLFLEDRHFRLAYFEPEEIGHKALAVNISDLAAMGAKPVSFQLGLGAPDWVDMPWLERFFQGMSALANTENIALSGGDISLASSLQIAITVLGQQLEGCNLLIRGGCMPGDAIFIIGKIGLARVGLNQMELSGREAMKSWPESCQALLKPMPKTDAGLMLARAAFNARPPALMDISDGICRDLPRLLGHKTNKAGLGAWLDPPEGSLPVEVIRHAEDLGLDPWIEAYLGGDDYALLGSCAPDMAGVLHSAIPGFTRIGEVTNTGKIYLWDRDLTGLSGFDHFANE